MPASKHRLLIGMAMIVFGVSGCASYKPDTRYLESEQRPPLQIPAGMDTPDYNEQMLIPTVKPVTTSDGAVDIGDSTALERPPHLDDVP